MENTIFALLLFVLYYGVLHAIFLPSTATEITSNTPTNSTKKTTRKSAPKGTEKTASKTYPEDVFKLLDESPDTVDSFVQSLSLLRARKVAKILNIKQTVTNNKKKKDKSLSWLKREIKQKLFSMSDTAEIDQIISQAKAS